MLDSRQARDLEKIYLSGNGYTLMQYASSKIFIKLLDIIHDKEAKIKVYAGHGNNGGDGYEVAALLLGAGYSNVVVYPVLDQKVGIAANDARRNFLLKGGKEKYSFTEQENNDVDYIIDAILGLGVCNDSSGKNADNFEKIIAAVDEINASTATVISIDVPTLLNSDNGMTTYGEAVEADYTITVFALKTGLLLGVAKDYCGEIFVVADDLDEFVKSMNSVMLASNDWCCLLTYDKLKEILPYRPKCAHKGTNGKVLTVGGNYGYTGALALASNAALRTGAGLVCALFLASREESKAPTDLSVMTCDRNEIANRLAWCNSVVVGPGYGRNEEDYELIEACVLSKKSLVIDADALWQINKHGLMFDADNKVVVTPHLGEAAMLCGIKPEQISENPLYYAKCISSAYNCVCVLKSSTTVITDGYDSFYIYNGGSSGMASGGMGDMLSGIIGTLLAQGYSAMNAAMLGVVIHGEAGRMDEEKNGPIGMSASDLIPYIRLLINGRT